MTKERTEKWYWAYWFLRGNGIKEGYCGPAGVGELVHMISSIELPKDYYQYAKKREITGNCTGLIYGVNQIGILLNSPPKKYGNLSFLLPSEIEKKGLNTYLLAGQIHPFRIYSPKLRLMGTYDVFCEILCYRGHRHYSVGEEIELIRKLKKEGSLSGAVHETI